MSNLSKRILSSIVLGSVVLLLIYIGKIYFDALLLICFLCGILEIYKLKKIYVKLLIFLILILFIFSSHNLRNLQNGLDILYLVLTITWLSDIGGYIFGKYIGGKTINVISPNKTYIGFVGSLIFSQFSFVVMILLNIKITNSITLTSLIFLISSLLVIIGDLIFSYLKRIEKIKDYSKLIPGHGGLFDRIDGLIFVIIFFNILLQSI